MIFVDETETKSSSAPYTPIRASAGPERHALRAAAALADRLRNDGVWHTRRTPPSQPPSCEVPRPPPNPLRHALAHSARFPSPLRDPLQAEDASAMADEDDEMNELGMGTYAPPLHHSTTPPLHHSATSTVLPVMSFQLKPATVHQALPPTPANRPRNVPAITPPLRPAPSTATRAQMRRTSTT